MTEQFEIRENKFYSFDVFDLLPKEVRWLATFQFFKDARSFVEAAQRCPQATTEADHG